MSASKTPMVVVYPRGQLSAKDKERMTKHGILCIEADEPNRVVTLLPSASFISADDMLMAGLKAVAESDYSATRQTFVKELYRRILLRESPAPPPPAPPEG